MGHGKSDRPFLSASEHSGVHGAHSASVGKVAAHLQQPASQPVSFDLCALSFQPWSNPVLAGPTSGHVFELTNLVPFIRKYSVHPVTGEPLDLSDITPLRFSRPEAGSQSANANETGFQDPVSYKPLGPHSAVVAIRTSGNVYLHETVARLNVRSKHWNDLLDDTPFTKADIVTLQDPETPHLRLPESFHHVKHALALTEADKGIDTSAQINPAAIGSAKSLLDMRRGNSSASADPGGNRTTTNDNHNHKTPSTAVSRNKAGGASTGMTAASFTASSLTPRTAIDRVVLDDQEQITSNSKTKPSQKQPSSIPMSMQWHTGYVRLVTNYGPLNIEVFCTVAPRAAYNFLALCSKGRYDGVRFHRNIPGFMIQGGDPTGSGSGGESIFGHDFPDEFSLPRAKKHDQRGLLAMANRGAHTNSSQFYITYRENLGHLDGKHTVFARLVDGGDDQTLKKLEEVPTNNADQPLHRIAIVNALVTFNPFDEYAAKKCPSISSAVADAQGERKRLARLERKRSRQADRTTWLGTLLPPRASLTPSANSDLKKLTATSTSTSTSTSAVGKYLKSTPTPTPTTTASSSSSSSQLHQPYPNKKAKPSPSSSKGGFGDFSSW
ncbi:hypothetical protein BCV70DRAFT_196300 [Testicularia cyperi]|uniref:Cyclophilin-like protein n=1 Tax=Testicularia cyperi TaxID=1882483 RepID=A0A317XEX5_9BASI|nr:hypothetical protein BCV70DRAFT_196300 [Testicularia cyperi]